MVSTVLIKVFSKVFYGGFVSADVLAEQFSKLRSLAHPPKISQTTSWEESNNKMMTVTTLCVGNAVQK